MNLRALFCTFALLAAGTSTAADRALLIGVSEYTDPGIIELPGVANDIKAMQQLVTTTLDYAPANVRVLTGPAATRANILAAINDWLVTGTAKDERALLYYSGHGSYVRDVSGDEADGLDETLAPADTSRTPQGLGNQVLDDELEGLLAKLDDRRVTAIFDSCNSGTVTRSLSGGPIPRSIFNKVVARPRDANAPIVANRKNLAVWTAAAASQAAVDDAGGMPPMGVFTRSFTGALRTRVADADRDGKVTHQELLNALTRESASFCKDKCLAPVPTLEVEPGMLAQPVEVSLKKQSALKLSTQLVATSVLPQGSPADILSAALQVAPAPKLPPMPAVNGAKPPAISAMPSGPLPTVLAASKPAPAASMLELEIRRDCRDGSCNASDPLPRAADGTVLLKGGQALSYRIKSPIAGQLVFLDIHPDGSISPIFPSPSFPLTTTQTVLAGKAKLLPGLLDPIQVTVTPPWGQGKLLAVVAEKSVDFSPLFTRSRNILVEGNADSPLERIAALLRKPVPFGKTELRAADYRIAHLNYAASP